MSSHFFKYLEKIFNLKNFTLLVEPNRERIPIYLAAINQKMVNLTWEIADGVIVGSAIVDLIAKKKINAVSKFVASLKKAINA